MNTTVRCLTRAACVAGVLVVGGFPGTAGAQSQTSSMPADQMGKMQVDEDQARSMMAEREKMMATMQAMDQQLDELVAQMNSATGTAKVDAIASVLTALVEQRQTMRSGMMGMQSQMMGHMMQHMMSMQGGMMGTGGAGMKGMNMMSCPMMQHPQSGAAPMK